MCEYGAAGPMADWLGSRRGVKMKQAGLRVLVRVDCLIDALPRVTGVAGKR